MYIIGMSTDRQNGTLHIIRSLDRPDEQHPEKELAGAAGGVNSGSVDQNAKSISKEQVGTRHPQMRHEISRWADGASQSFSDWLKGHQEYAQDCVIEHAVQISFATSTPAAVCCGSDLVLVP